MLPSPNQHHLQNLNHSHLQPDSLSRFPLLPPTQSSAHEIYYASSSPSSTRHRRSPKTSVGFRRVLRGSLDLHPIVNQAPLERRLDPINGGYISPLKALTIHLASTYRLINPNFRYELSLNPRRVLTKPSKPAGNNGLDNQDSDYILYVNDILGGASSSDPLSTSRSPSASDHKYLILDVLGQGTFGQVVKCQDMKTHEVVAVKVVKNKQAYFSQSMMEVTILELLNNTWDPENKHHILRMKDTFIHHNHLCLVFELLSSNLYELIKQNSFRGLSTSLVRVFANQLLDALTVLNEAHLIHCDLKPENILLTSLSSPEIKVIDFGSACHERQTVYTYIQSRFYRSPEVILGLPYSSAIDMWSLGCICVELFLGLPLFPGTSEYNQISRIVEMLGMPPPYMLEMGKQTLQFFDAVEDKFNLGSGGKTYKLKSLEQYSKEHSVQEQPSKRYFAQHTLEDIISQYPVIRKGMKSADLEKEKHNRIAFIDFVRGLLNINPIERWSPQQARSHPFILGEPLREPYVPMKSSYQSSGHSGPGGSGMSDPSRSKALRSLQSQLTIESQPSSQPPSNCSKTSSNPPGSSDASALKRPYGGLPAAPVRSSQKVYDAAAYSQLQAQQQAINAQAAALRQQQAQAAQQNHNPYALPSPDARPNLVHSSSQSSQPPPQHHLPVSTQQSVTMHHQYPTSRLPSSHNTHLSNMVAPPITHTSYLGPRGGPMSGSLPGSNVTSSLPHSQAAYHSYLGDGMAAGTGRVTGNLVGATGGRQRSGTLDQMDLVPPQLQKVQSDLTHYAGQSVTPVLRRDDQYLAWEQRQQQQLGVASGAGTVGSGSTLTRRPSHRANPQLDFLHEQAESGDGWNMTSRQSSFSHYPSLSNPSTYYMPSSERRAMLGPEGALTECPASQEGSGYDMVPLDAYDHRDGGQAMAYIPMVPKSSLSTSSAQATSSGPGPPPSVGRPVAGLVGQGPGQEDHYHQPVVPLAALMNSGAPSPATGPSLGAGSGAGVMCYLPTISMGASSGAAHGHLISSPGSGRPAGRGY